METLHAIGVKLGADVTPPDARWVYEVLAAAHQNAAAPEEDTPSHQSNLSHFSRSEEP